MWWHEQVLIWRDLAPFQREVPLFALIPLVDAFTGLSKFVAKALNLPKGRDPVLLVMMLLVYVVRTTQWGDYARWGGSYDFDTAPHDDALFDAWIHHLNVLTIYFFIYLGLICSCAIICAIWAKLQKRSFFVWLPIGLIGTVGAIVWLFVNRPSKTSARLATASQD